MSRGRDCLVGSRVLLAGFWFEVGFVFTLLVDLQCGFKRVIYLVDAFVLGRGAWVAVDAIDYVMRSRVPPLLVCFAFHAPSQSRDFTKYLWDEANLIIEEC